jgi:hypothetical protein
MAHYCGEDGDYARMQNAESDIMSTPNPENFARLVLSQLAYIQADISTTQAMIAELLESGKEMKDITVLKKWKAYTDEMAQKLFENSIREAGLDNPPDPPETPSTRP